MAEEVESRAVEVGASPPRWFVYREKGNVPRAYDTETFGGFARWIMVQKRLTRRSVALAASVDPSHLHRIITGAREPSNRKIVGAIVNALGVDADTKARLWILAGHRSSNPTLEAVAKVLDSDHLTIEAKAEFAVTVERIAAWRLGNGRVEERE